MAGPQLVCKLVNCGKISQADGLFYTVHVEKPGAKPFKGNSPGNPALDFEPSKE
jgi:hypothetical protein